VDRDLDLTVSLDPSRPLFARVLGSPEFTSESAIVYEAGYRAQRGERFLFDAALFHNEYKNLSSVEAGAPFLETDAIGVRTVAPFRLGNGIRGHVRGLELAADVRVTDAWRVHGSYSLADISLRPRPGSLDTTTAASTEGGSPRHRGLLRSSLTFGTVQLDAIWRRVSSLPAQNVPAYSSLNARAAWRPWAPLEIAVVGGDLLQPHHPEFGGGAEVQRSVYGEVAWRFCPCARSRLPCSWERPWPRPSPSRRRLRPAPRSTRSRRPSSTTSRASSNGRRPRGRIRARPS